MATFNDVLLSLQHSYFIDRKDILQTFIELIQKVPSTRKYHILEITGTGGIGKSLLLGEFKRICATHGIPNSIVSMDACQSPLDLLINLRSNFEAKSINKGFNEFDSLLKKLKIIENKLHQKQVKGGKISEILSEFLGEASASGICETISGLTLGPAGILLAAAGGLLAKRSLNTATETMLKYDIISTEDVELLNNLLDNLVKYFSLGIERESAKKTSIVLMIDTYEYVQKFERLEKWVGESFFSNLTDKALIVISGRNKPQGKFWQSFSSLIVPYELLPFSKEDISEYLKIRGLSEDHIERLFRTTAGLPLGTALWVDIEEKIASTGEEVRHEKILTEVTKTVVERLLENVNDSTQDLIQICAIPRQFDEQIMVFLIPGINVSLIFKQLRTYSSIFRLRLHGLSMHEEVRTYLLSDFKMKNRQHYYDLNLKMAQFYDQKAQKEIKYNRLWFNYRMETAYYLLAADSADGFDLLNDIVGDAASMWDVGVLEMLLNVISDNPDQNIHWTKYLFAIITYLKRDFYTAKDLLLEVGQMPLPLLQAGIFEPLSHVLLFLGEYKAALDYGIKSLELYESIKHLKGAMWMYERLGWIYFRLGLFEKAKFYQSKGLELAKGFEDKVGLGWALNGSGGVQIESGNLRESEILLKQALKIWGELAHNGGNFYSQIHLGIAYLNGGMLNLAIESFQKALKAFPEFDDESWALARLGQAYCLQGYFDKAILLLEKSRLHSQDHNRPHFEVEAEWFLGDLYFLQNKFEQAKINYFKQMKISKKIGNVYMETKALLGILRTKYFHHSTISKILQIIHKIDKSAKDYNFHSISAEVYIYKSLIQMQDIIKCKQDNTTFSTQQINQISQQFLYALEESMLYNSHILDKTLRKIIVLSRNLDVDFSDAVCGELINCWNVTESAGKSLLNLESKLRERDCLPHAQISVIDQLANRSSISLLLSDLV